jgi:hypothetical protein
MRWALALALLASPVAAQQPCFPYDEFQQGAAEQGVTLAFGGVTGDRQGMVQIYTNADGRWILVRVALNGVTCLLTGGTEFRMFDPIPQGEDS